MTEVYIGWRRRKGSAQQQIDQEKNAAALVSGANSATRPFAIHRAVCALLHYSGTDHRALRRLNVQSEPTQERANLSVLQQRLPAQLPKVKGCAYLIGYCPLIACDGIDRNSSMPVCDLDRS
jgi:hypothetical protein